MNISKFPNREKLSLVVSTILLAFALPQLIAFPTNESNLNIGGFIIPFTFNYATIITIATAGLTASGTDWILRDHPEIRKFSSVPHLLLPALSAWVLSVTLNNMENSPSKWGALFTGGILLMLVISAEYISEFKEGYQQPLAVSLLTSLSYALFLALTISLFSGEQRLIIILPAVAIGTGALSMRTNQLHIQKGWPILESAVCLLVITQIASVLHYLPISPLSASLFLFGILYFVVNLIIGLDQKESIRLIALEVFLPLVLIFGLAIWIV